MKYVIPSFQRSEILQQKTLKYLDSMGVDRTSVYVFIREDDKDYEGYNKITDINLLPIDIKGIGETHNYITKHFDEGEFIVEIDDDLEYMVDNERKPIESFIGLCEEMKEKMEYVNCSYGGSYSVANPLFMSKCERYTTKLSYCLGCVRWRFIRKDIKLETNYAEDMENQKCPLLVACSALVTPEIKKNALAHGFDMAVQSPLTNRILEDDILKEVIARRGNLKHKIL